MIQNTNDWPQETHRILLSAKRSFKLGENTQFYGQVTDILSNLRVEFIMKMVDLEIEYRRKGKDVETSLKYLELRNYVNETLKFIDNSILLEDLKR